MSTPPSARGLPSPALEPPPSGPATAGAQPRSPLSEGAAESGLALGAAAGLEPPATPPAPAPRTTTPGSPQQPARATVRVFRSGLNDVYLHTLRSGVQVIAGTVLGHVGAEASGVGDTGAGAQGTSAAGSAQTSAPHMLFQIKPAGVGAPLVDPKPILDGWVALESTSIFRAKGENPFLQTAPSVGQVLLESKGQLEQLLGRDASIHMHACERRDVQTGRVDRRILATLEFLSVSGLKPTASGLKCAGAAPAVEGNASAGSGGDTVKIVAVNGIPIAGHQGQGSIADTMIRRLLTLQGVNRPLRIVSQTSIPGATITFVKPSARAFVYVAFRPLGSSSGAGAHAASAFGSVLSAKEWIKLIARLGEIPDPTVASGPSAAAVPDRPGTPAPSPGSTGGGGSATPGASGAGTPGAGANGAGASEGGAGGHG